MEYILVILINIMTNYYMIYTLLSTIIKYKRNMTNKYVT